MRKGIPSFPRRGSRYLHLTFLATGPRDQFWIVAAKAATVAPTIPILQLNLFGEVFESASGPTMSKSPDDAKLVDSGRDQRHGRGP